jgi:gas vesicle protein
MFGGVPGAAIGAAVGGIAGLIGGINSVARAMREANQATSDQVKKLQTDLLSTMGTITQVDTWGKILGVDLAAAWGDQSQAGLAHFQGLLDQFNGKMTEAQQILASYGLTLEQVLRGDTMPSLDAISAAAGRYGLVLDDLGKKVQFLSMSDWARQMVADFRLFQLADVDNLTVLTKMSTQVNDMIAQSMKFGIALPETMRPIIEAMNVAGLLTGGIDISSLIFAPDLTQATISLTDSINELINTIRATPPASAVPHDGTNPNLPGVGGGGRGGGTANIYLDRQKLVEAIVPGFPDEVMSYIGV